ncbi:MAG TPA: RimK-like ATPgrasp N-terminal domain-containing protein, partial [Gammaproteobacteria bacterium]
MQDQQAQRHLIVIEKSSDWKPEFPDYPVVTAREYLSNPDYGRRGIIVLNLCRNFGYLTTGYYCSLLAEARRHRMVPSVRTLSDLTRKSIYSLDAEDLGDRLQKALRGEHATMFEIMLYFGRQADPRLTEISRQIFDA